MPLAVVDVVVTGALAGLLAVAYVHPRARVELLAGLAAVAACVAVGALDWSATTAEWHRLWPVVLLLVALLVVSDLLRRDGVFEAVGRRLHGPRMFGAVFAAATLTTVVLGLDATVVLLTPVVLSLTASRTRADLANELVTIRLANSASLLLPVSNLTNLLALPDSGLSFSGWVVLVTPAWVVVLLVEYAALRLVRGPRVAADPPVSEPAPLPRTPLVVVALMLVGFAVASPLGVEPAWVASAAAVVLGLRAWRSRQVTIAGIVHAAHLPFAVFVLCLGLVVAAVTHVWLGEALAPLVPSGDGVLALLGVAALGALLANLVNNLPATLVLAPLVAPAGATAVVALLIGINVGSGLTWTGSLANLLWRRTLVAHGRPVPSRAFHLVAAATTAPAVVGGVLVLALTAHALGR